MTPEGKIKRKVSMLLRATKCMYYEMPVPGGYGKTTLDYVGCHYGRYFAIETKAPGKKPTDRQNATMENMRRAGAKTFVIDGPEGIAELEAWLIEGDWLSYESEGSEGEE
jgi:hypothetical protein